MSGGFPLRAEVSFMETVLKQAKKLRFKFPVRRSQTKKFMKHVLRLARFAKLRSLIRRKYGKTVLNAVGRAIMAKARSIAKYARIYKVSIGSAKLRVIG